MTYSNEANAFFDAANQYQMPWSTTMKDTMYAWVLSAGGLVAAHSWTIGNGAGQKPAGNTLQDDVFIGVTIDKVALIMIDNTGINNPSVQSITLDATTGTFDFTAIDGLKAGGPSGITIYLSTNS